MSITLLQGDCRELLDTLEAGSVQTIVTSPPYWRLRRYTDDPREIGQEDSPAAYVAALVDVFERCRRVLRDDGTLWLNIGDCYASSSTYNASRSMHTENEWKQAGRSPNAGAKAAGLPPKSLIGLPWRVAFALQDAGWILRSDIIWAKTNPMPESVTDRPTRAHEYVFLFSKNERYYYDSVALREAESAASTARYKYAAPDGRINKAGAYREAFDGTNDHGLMGRARTGMPQVPTDGKRNARSVWSISTQGLPDKHYAPMPEALAERCIKAGSRSGDTVLDPFAGSGTTGRTALALQRRAVLIDLAYSELQERRTDGVQVQMVEVFE